MVMDHVSARGMAGALAQGMVVLLMDMVGLVTDREALLVDLQEAF
ncbi:hypothetical protein [Bacillus sp. EB01]|nr:hypothetical protein [Bacillus sp. EB01]